MLHIFIINPFAGDKTFADDLRTKLSSIEGLDYFVFNTRYAGYETELVRKILHIFRIGFCQAAVNDCFFLRCQSLLSHKALAEGEDKVGFHRKR